MFETHFKFYEFEIFLNDAIYGNKVSEFANFMNNYAFELRLEENEYFHVLNTILSTPYVTAEVVEIALKNGFTVLNDSDSYIMNSLHIANHRNLSQEIKDLLIQHGASIESLGENSKYNEDMVHSRNLLLRQNTERNISAIKSASKELTILGNNAHIDLYDKDNNLVSKVFESKDICNVISSFIGFRSVLGDNINENLRITAANDSAVLTQSKIDQLRKRRRSDQDIDKENNEPNQMLL